jgi:rod shape-determining protein MreC
VLVGLCIAGFVLGQLQTVANNDAKTDFFTRAIQSVVYPVASTLTNAANYGDDFWTGVRDAHSLRQQNARLRAEAEGARMYQETLDRLQRKLDDLNRMNGYDAPGPFEKVYAGVVGYFPRENRATLNKGSNDGIEKHMPVIAADGLVGIVDTVDKTRCQILLVTSRAIRVGVKVIGTTDVPGIARGETSKRLVIDMLSADEVHTGERVITSGYSETIPAGIPVGVVVEAVDSPQFGTKQVFVLPAVKMGDLDEVFVLK